MSQQDTQWWSFVIGLLVFVSVVGLVYIRRRRRGPQPPSTTVERWSSAAPTKTAPSGTSGESTGTERRRPAAPPPQGTPNERASAVRSLILRAAAERVPSGWSVLLLTPPPNAEQMTWHVHLAPSVALDLMDGRTVPAAPPPPSHDWQLAGGRTVGVGQGELDPQPTEDTKSVRVTGPYLIVVVGPSGGGQEPRLTARVVTTGDTLPEPRASLADTRAVQAALREAIELAIGSRMSGTPPALGYRLPAWAGHERTWLTISR